MRIYEPPIDRRRVASSARLALQLDDFSELVGHIYDGALDDALRSRIS
jgi:hypothetical protein